MVQYNGDIKSRKYRAKIYLTSKGKEVAEKITQITDYAVEIGSSGISIEERESLYKSLDIICNNLKKKCNSYGEK